MDEQEKITGAIFKTIKKKKVSKIILYIAPMDKVTTVFVFRTVTS